MSVEDVNIARDAAYKAGRSKGRDEAVSACILKMRTLAPLCSQWGRVALEMAIDEIEIAHAAGRLFAKEGDNGL